MNFRLKTSKETGDLLVSLQSSTNFTWNILARIAVALSINIDSIPDYVQDKQGVDIHRNALTGEHDFVFKAIIKQHTYQITGEIISEEDYFPDLFNAHLERGIKLLNNEYQHAGNYEKLLINLINYDS